MDKTQMAKEIFISGTLLIVGTGLVSRGTKGIEKVTPIIIDTVKNWVKKK